MPPTASAWSAMLKATCCNWWRWRRGRANPATLGEANQVPTRSPPRNEPGRRVSAGSSNVIMHSRVLDFGLTDFRVLDSRVLVFLQTVFRRPGFRRKTRLGQARPHAVGEGLHPGTIHRRPGHDPVHCLKNFV